MKEATGELSTTVIAVVAIGLVLTIFTTLLLPSLRSSIQSKMRCGDAYGCVCDGSGKCDCKWDDENGETKNVSCNDPAFEDKK